jgi:Glutathione S-transferase, C-terminal domain
MPSWPLCANMPSVRQALRLLGSSSGVEGFEIAFIKGLSQRTGAAQPFHRFRKPVPRNINLIPVPGQDKNPLWLARVHNQFVPIKGVTDEDGLKSLFLSEHIPPTIPKPVLTNSLPPLEQVIAGPTKNAVRDEGNLQSVLLCDACLQHEVLQSSTNRIARRKLAILEQQLGKTLFFGGHRWNMADFMVACGLSRLKLDLAAYPRIDDWLAAGAGG